ncbi:MAG: hypothetical protein HY547_00785 [Elusimicrobia bacterium]|nr:hypothetical protein [Elusimicrobiota bacterium]
MKNFSYIMAVIFTVGLMAPAQAKPSASRAAMKERLSRVSATSAERSRPSQDFLNDKAHGRGILLADSRGVHGAPDVYRAAGNSFDRNAAAGARRPPGRRDDRRGPSRPPRAGRPNPRSRPRPAPGHPGHWHHHARWPHAYYHQHYPYHHHVPRLVPAWYWHPSFWIWPGVYFPVFMVHVYPAPPPPPAVIIYPRHLIVSWSVVYGPELAPYELKIFYRDGYYWAWHYDHYDRWHGPRGLWWCSTHMVYLDWGYPAVFLEHQQITRKIDAVVDPNDEYSMKVDDVQYYRHGEQGEADHYDRFDADQDAYYCVKHKIYYKRLAEKEDGKYEYIDDYDVFWSEADEMYVVFTPDASAGNAPAGRIE